MLITEMQKERDAIKVEARTIIDKAKTEKRVLSEDENKDVIQKHTRINELDKMIDAESRQLEIESRAKEVATVNLTDNQHVEMRTLVEKGKVEIRAIALGGTGPVSYGSNFLTEAPKHAKILQRVFIEPNATPGVQFPLLSAVTNINAVTEDGTGSAASGAAFSPKLVTPVAHLGYTYISDLAIRNYPALESRLQAAVVPFMSQSMAAEAVSTTFAAYATSGITHVDCTNATAAPILTDAKTGIGHMVGRYGRSMLTVVTNPAYVAAWRAADTYGQQMTYNPQLEGYTIDGVLVIEDDNAPTTTTAGSSLVVVGAWQAYEIATTSTIIFETLSKTAGSNNVPIQFQQYFAGAIVDPKAFVVMTAKSGS